MAERYEMWKPVYLEPYNQKYMVSSFGRVKSIDTYVNYREKVSKKISKRLYPGRILRGATANGYRFVSLKSNGNCKQIYVHRLVAFAFVGGYKPDLVVNHKDENRQNNDYLNLEWVTQKYNANYGHHNENVSKALRRHFDAIKN